MDRHICKNASKNLPSKPNLCKPTYRVVHVDTEGGPFVAGGNGTYINALINNQAKKQQQNNKRIALVLPAYHPIGRAFSCTGKQKLYFNATVYTLAGKKTRVELTAWKETKGNIDFFYLEPDKNHSGYFTTQADEKGDILGIRTIPLEFTPTQNKNKALIKILENQLFHNTKHRSHITRSTLLKSDFHSIDCHQLTDYSHDRIKLQTAYDELQAVFEGRRPEISLYMRNAHYHEISGALIDHLLENHLIEVVHTHDYGNTVRHITKKIAKVNTFHSDPGQGILPYYIKQQWGIEATQRGDAMIHHHIVYAVSEAYANWLESPHYSNAHYTKPMSIRGRIGCVTSIPDIALHGLHKMKGSIEGYASNKAYAAMEVYQKKQLAKQILADKLKQINPNFKFDPQKKTLLFLSRISPAKGSDFIEDIIQFSEKNNCNCIICGFHGFEGSEKLLKRLRQRYPQVPIIIGKEEQAKLGCLHRAASDIGVGVSLEEAFGLSYSECLLYGTMCVISDVGGSRNAVLNKNLCGIVFPLFKGKHKRYAQLQKKMCELKNNLQELEEKNSSTETLWVLKKQQAEIEAEIDRDFVLPMPQIKKELAEKRNALISYLNELNVITLEDVKKISHLEKELQKVDERINYFNRLDKPSTTLALFEGLKKALEIIRAAPEIANYIFDTAQNAFSPRVWTEKIENIYQGAQMMLNSENITKTPAFLYAIQKQKNNLVSPSMRNNTVSNTEPSKLRHTS